MRSRSFNFFRENGERSFKACVAFYEFIFFYAGIFSNRMNVSANTSVGIINFFRI